MPYAIGRRLIILSQKGYFLTVELSIVQTHIVYFAVEGFGVILSPSTDDDLPIRADMRIIGIAMHIIS